MKVKEYIKQYQILHPDKKTDQAVLTTPDFWDWADKNIDRLEFPIYCYSSDLDEYLYFDGSQQYLFSGGEYHYRKVNKLYVMHILTGEKVKYYSKNSFINKVRNDIKRVSDNVKEIEMILDKI